MYLITTYMNRYPGSRLLTAPNAGHVIDIPFMPVIDASLMRSKTGGDYEVLMILPFHEV